jgi:hypothetical protein
MHFQRYSIERMTKIVLLMICALPSFGAAAGALSERDVLCFDPGPVGAPVAARAFELNLDSSYSPEVGYGWTQHPSEGFDRRELQRSRTALTIDGVSGKQLAFQADISPGKWDLMLWLETGETDQHWPRIRVNGRQQPLHWQSFQLSAEPRLSSPKQFRIFHGTTTVASAGIRIELVAAEDRVRLLGISLIRETSPKKSEHRVFLGKLEAAGNYQNCKPLSELLRQADSSLKRNPNDTFYAIWQQRLDLLAAAERYYSMRGCQWADEQTCLTGC